MLDGDDGRITYRADKPGGRNIDLYREAMERYVADLGVSGLGRYDALNMALNPRWNYLTAGAPALRVSAILCVKPYHRRRDGDGYGEDEQASWEDSPAAA